MGKVSNKHRSSKRYNSTQNHSKYSLATLAPYIITFLFGVLILTLFFYGILSIEITYILGGVLVISATAYAMIMKKKKKTTNQSKQTSKKSDNQDILHPSASYKERGGIQLDNDQEDIGTYNKSTSKSYSQAPNKATEKNAKVQKNQESNYNSNKYKTNKNQPTMQKYDYSLDKSKPKYDSKQKEKSVFTNNFKNPNNQIQSNTQYNPNKYNQPQNTNLKTNQNQYNYNNNTNQKSKNSYESPKQPEPIMVTIVFDGQSTGKSMINREFHPSATVKDIRGSIANQLKKDEDIIFVRYLKDQKNKVKIDLNSTLNEIKNKILDTKSHKRILYMEIRENNEIYSQSTTPKKPVQPLPKPKETKIEKEDDTHSKIDQKVKNDIYSTTPVKKKATNLNKYRPNKIELEESEEPENEVKCTKTKPNKDSEKLTESKKPKRTISSCRPKISSDTTTTTTTTTTTENTKNSVKSKKKANYFTYTYSTNQDEDKHTIELDSDATVLTLKEHIADDYGVDDPKTIKIIFAGKDLLNKIILKELEVNDDELFAYIRTDESVLVQTAKALQVIRLSSEDSDDDAKKDDDDDDDYYY